MQSIRELGLLQPIVVRWVKEIERYRIIAGERRFRAVSEVGLATIPCWIQDRDDVNTQLASLAENWTRLELRPMELARALVRLRDSGLSQTDIARRTGKSAGEISKLLKLLTSHPDVQKLAEEEPSALTKRHLYALADLPLEAQPALARRIVQNGLTADETNDEVRRHKVNTGEPVRRRPSFVRRFTTSRGMVTFTAAPGEVSDDDVLEAINEVRQQLGAK